MIRKAAIFSVTIAIIFAVASCAKDEATGPKDKTGPTVSVVTPWDDTIRFGLVDVTVDAEDDAGIHRVEVYVNNSLIGTDTTEPYEVEWDMDPLSDESSNSLYAIGVDVNGNRTKSDVVTVTKGVTAAPVVTLTGPTDGTSIQQGDMLTFSGSATDEEDGR